MLFRCGINWSTNLSIADGHSGAMIFALPTGMLRCRFHFNFCSLWSSVLSLQCCTLVGFRFQSAFFTAGQVLPTHRSQHSSYGGLFQPTVTQAIRLLSRCPQPPDPHAAAPERQRWSIENTCVDPFSEVATAYTTTGNDSYLAPSAYSINSYSWIHIFPEGKVHQASDKTMRYFKWGVSRLILEAT